MAPLAILNLYRGDGAYTLSYLRVILSLMEQYGTERVLTKALSSGRVITLFSL